MNNYKLKIEKILTITIIVSIIIVVISLFMNNYIEKKEDILKVGGIYGTITMIIGALWYFLKNYGWKLSLFQYMKSISNIPPNLNGRWEGTFIRPEHTKPYPFVIEIEQTIDTIVLNTYTRNGNNSKSSVYNILTNDLQSTFYLNYLWQGGSKKSVFNGFTLLKLIEHKEGKKLVGSYFTDREPDQTKGELIVHWKTEELKKEF